MKKTLITLAALALASVAQAATTYTYDADDFTTATTTNGSFGKLTLDTTLTKEFDWTITATFTLGDMKNSSYNDWGSAIFTTTSDVFDANSGLQVYVPVAKKDIVDENGEKIGEERVDPCLQTFWYSTTAHNSSVMTGMAEGDVLTVIYTYDADGKGENGGLLTVDYQLVRSGHLYEDGISKPDSWYQYTVGSNKTLSIDSVTSTIGYGGLTSANGWSINSVTVTVIPEPTTATLSLLALAGLAARRRRK